jgi:Spx/MgsR family transcriptional regulator
MSQVSIYLYGSCSSCKDAEAVLKAADVDYRRRDIFKQRLSVEELYALFHETGKQPVDLLSRRSIPYRTLDLANRELSDHELVELMSQHPALIRRPIIIVRDAVQVGFNRDALVTLAHQYG